MLIIKIITLFLILITNLKSGLYDLYVFDTIPNSIYGLYGCPQQAQIFIDEPQNELTSTVNLLENVICFGDSTGKAISNVQGGQFPYIYAWDNGDSTQINSNLWAGWQGVTFTDANNCTLRDSIEIINVNPAVTHKGVLEIRLSKKAIAVTSAIKNIVK